MMARLPLLMKLKSLRDHRQLATGGTLPLRMEPRLKNTRVALAAELEAIAVGGTNHSLAPVKTTKWKILEMLQAIVPNAIANHRKKNPPRRRRRAKPSTRRERKCLISMSHSSRGRSSILDSGSISLRNGANAAIVCS